jgi:hypothetical protein
MSKFQGHHQKKQLHLRRRVSQLAIWWGKARSKYARQGKEI